MLRAIPKSDKFYDTDKLSGRPYRIEISVTNSPLLVRHQMLYLQELTEQLGRLSSELDHLLDMADDRKKSMAVMLNLSQQREAIKHTQMMLNSWRRDNKPIPGADV